MYSTCRQLIFTAVKLYEDVSASDSSTKSAFDCHFFSWLFEGQDVGDVYRSWLRSAA